MDLKKINNICYDRRVQYVRKRLREVVLVRYLKDTRCQKICGFDASPGLSLRSWSLIEVLSLIQNTLGLFLFPLGLGAWTAERLLPVLGLLLVCH